MKLEILGSAGAEFPDFHPPAFLLDGRLLLDAGTIGAVLNEDEQWKIRDIFITHSHLDHIRGIPALADNIIMKNLKHSITVHSTDAVLSALGNHIFNGSIWPDFTQLPTPESPVIKYETIAAYQKYQVKDYSIEAIPVNHSVPAVGFRVTSGGKTLVYTGDTGPTEEIWKYCSGVDVLIVEVSFPNNMETLALITKHLTSSMLVEELAKIDELPRQILITHPKPQYYDIIMSEIDCLEIKGIELLHDGSVYNI